ncbi:MAG: MBL fold metallo-hydrolase [Acidobacteria bacterium]|nr:MBL fold metallo-hydrolase [Acidobacteriota bacterium]
MLPECTVIMAGTIFPYFSSNVVLIRGRHNILVDTGNVHLRSKLMSGLHAEGLEPEQIHCVINTHLHYDHCGNNQLFPHARVIITRHEMHYLEYIMARGRESIEEMVARHYGHLTDRQKTAFVNLAVLNMKVLDYVYENRCSIEAFQGSTLRLEALTLEHTPGHTPGHLVVCLEEPDGRKLTVTGDVVVSKEDFVNDGDSDPLTMNHAELLEGRKRITGRTHAIIPGHGPRFDLQELEGGSQMGEPGGARGATVAGGRGETS